MHEDIDVIMMCTGPNDYSVVVFFSTMVHRSFVLLHTQDFINSGKICVLVIELVTLQKRCMFSLNRKVRD